MLPLIVRGRSKVSGKPHFFGSLRPLRARKFLHVGLGIGFVDDLQPKQRLDDVFERHESRRALRTRQQRVRCGMLIRGHLIEGHRQLRRFRKRIESGEKTPTASRLPDSLAAASSKSPRSANPCDVIRCANIQRDPREGRSFVLLRVFCATVVSSGK